MCLCHNSNFLSREKEIEGWSQSAAVPPSCFGLWIQFKTHSSQLHRWCSRAVVFFTQCQESKPANPLRYEVLCTFCSELHWGLLCYLAHASHPAESKCSQSKVRWRQQLCCGRLGKAGKGLEGWGSLILSEVVCITAWHPFTPSTPAHEPLCPGTWHEFY